MHESTSRIKDDPHYVLPCADDEFCVLFYTGTCILRKSTEYISFECHKCYECVISELCDVRILCNMQEMIRNVFIVIINWLNRSISMAKCG